jgi:hypothetical protein
MAQIDKPNLHFNTVLYTGNASTNAITGVGFQPDLIWGKDRGGDRHWWADAVRGKSGTGYYLLASNNNEAQTGNYPPDGVTTIGSDGFTLGANSSNDYGGWSNEINQSSGSYVAWNWKAANSSGSSNSDGTITSTVSANTTSGFSIVKWTGNGTAGATIGHGLGATPAMIIEKITSSTGDWLVYHHKNTSSPETDFLRFSTDAATQDELTVWNDQAPTSSVFYVGSESTVNGNGNNFIAYCFAEKKGFSKFGSYTGNGNADGPFIYTGFKPAFVIIKRTNSAKDWFIWDNKTAPRNVTNAYLRVNTNGAAGSYDWLDFVSNGIKIRNTSDGASGSGDTYIYMAFAENPIVGSNNIPATAR